MSAATALILLACLIISLFVFRAAMRTLDVRVRWWRVIAGLLLLRCSNLLLTPVVWWIDYAWRSLVVR